MQREREYKRRARTNLNTISGFNRNHRLKSAGVRKLAALMRAREVQTKETRGERQTTICCSASAVQCVSACAGEKKKGRERERQRTRGRTGWTRNADWCGHTRCNRTAIAYEMHLLVSLSLTDAHIICEGSMKDWKGETFSKNLFFSHLNCLQKKILVKLNKLINSRLNYKSFVVAYQSK